MKNRVLIVVVLAALVLGGGLTAPRPALAGGSYCHVVRVGENLSSIAVQYGVSVQALVTANHLSNPNLIYVGQCLILPTAQTTCGSCTKIHIVQPGEYLKLIAAKYGSTWECIAQKNGLANPNVIYPGQRLVVPVKCSQPKPTPTPKPVAGEWTAQYWNNPYLSGNPTLVNHPTNLAFNWKQAGPGGGIAGTNFSARFTRTKSFDAGRYRFRLLVDDGVRFWLDGILLVDKWQDSAPVEYIVEKQLSAGSHSIQIDYYQHTGGAQLTFTIELLNGTPAWKCEYFNNITLAGAPVTTQYYSALDFAWGNTAPAPGVTADYYSTRCTGDFTFVGGKYQFSATVDDGVRVFVDGNTVIDQWHLSAPTTYNVDLDVGAGAHPIKVEYFENNGGATLKVRWTQK
jgi:LysM repeat protein